MSQLQKWLGQMQQGAVASFKFDHSISMAIDEEGDVIATVPELNGCMAHGRTHHEALEHLREVYEMYLVSLKESGQPIPPPRRYEGRE